jgi:tetratricopeptide (TPR) repeat protein
VSEQGDHSRARELHEEALRLRRSLGDPLLVANAANNLGVAALAEGDLARSRAAFEESLGLARELGDRIHIAAAQCGLGQTALLAGEPGRAVGHLHEALELYVALADERDCAECVSALAGAAAASGRHVEAARLWGCADALRGAPASGVAARIEERFRPEVIDALGREPFGSAAEEGASLRLERLAAGDLATLPAAAARQ